MRTIRVSEIASYTYCQRAWWYQVNGELSANQLEMTDGAALHEQHGRKVYLAGCLRALAYALLLLALVILAVEITLQLL
ncbi:MAG: hypothetical protein A2W33_09215 [Chloroflexi bacterium RBG_16_52_11]|nr:MAG: hypothetical protein A2W33_09215 [Chloroflexi bacterium RBG_16_52_11]